MRPEPFIGLAGKRAELAVSMEMPRYHQQSREGGKDNGQHGDQASLFLLSPVARYNASVG